MTTTIMGENWLDLCLTNSFLCTNKTSNVKTVLNTSSTTQRRKATAVERSLPYWAKNRLCQLTYEQTPLRKESRPSRKKKTKHLAKENKLELNLCQK